MHPQIAKLRYQNRMIHQDYSGLRSPRPGRSYSTYSCFFFKRFRVRNFLLMTFGCYEHGNDAPLYSLDNMNLSHLSKRCFFLKNTFLYAKQHLSIKLGRSRTYLQDCLWSISWENNRDCYITMPLSLKTMEVQIKGGLWNKRFRTVRVYCYIFLNNSYIFLPFRHKNASFLSYQRGLIWQQDW